jgi:MFS superfamily sulfate permease-like transporter
MNAHPNNIGLSLLMESLNDTIDVSAEQLQALTSHVPTPIVMLTFVLVTLGALSLGLRFAADKSRPVLLSAIYVVANVVVISMMVDYDRPQTGIVNVNLNPIKIQLKSMQQSP